MDKAYQSNVVIKLWSYYIESSPYPTVCFSCPQHDPSRVLHHESVMARLIVVQHRSFTLASFTLEQKKTKKKNHLTLQASFVVLLKLYGLSQLFWFYCLSKNQWLLSRRYRRGGVLRLVRLIAIKDLVTGHGTALRSVSSSLYRPRERFICIKVRHRVPTATAFS